MSAVAVATAPEVDDRAEIDVAAPPRDVWALVADIGSMRRWSPETFRTEWLDGVTVAAAGARFRGWNRWRGVRWATYCEVEVCEPGREFTFSTRFWGRVGTRWSYAFADNGAGGTRVTETRRQVHQPLYARIAYLTVLRGHTATFQPAMEETLRRLKAAAEAS